MIALFASAACKSESRPEDPTTDPDVTRLVPVGWSMTQSVPGDLNGDGAEDLAAVVLRGESADGNPAEEEGARGLLVLFADPEGGYRIQEFAPAALPCAYCLGALGGAPDAPAFALAIEDGKLSVGWLRGSREMVEVRLTIVYDAERGALRLAGDEMVTSDRLSGASSRLVRDYVTGTETGEGGVTSRPPRFVPLTEVSGDDY
jgi:hypothetical protein